MLKEILKTKFSPELESDMRALLALALIEKGEVAEARDIGGAGCNTVGETMRAELVKHGVCQQVDWAALQSRNFGSI